MRILPTLKLISRAYTIQFVGSILIFILLFLLFLESVYNPEIAARAPLVVGASEPATSEFFHVLLAFFYTHSYTYLVDDTLELHVRSLAFDKECAVYANGIGKGPIRPQRFRLLRPHQSLGGLLRGFFHRVLSLQCLQARGPPLLFWYPGFQTLGSQVDLPDVQGCLHSAFGARARFSSYAASASLRASQTWKGQSVGEYSFQS